jgi:hypothetical protein
MSERECERATTRRRNAALAPRVVALRTVSGHAIAGHLGGDEQFRPRDLILLFTRTHKRTNKQQMSMGRCAWDLQNHSDRECAVRT